MPVIVVGNEKNFTALRPRLFAGKVATKVAREVADEIRKANPHVDLDRLKPGTVLTVPDSPSIGVRGELSLDETTRAAIDGLANVGQSALDDLASRATQAEAEEKAERARVLKALDGVGRDTSARVRDRDLAKDVQSARGALEEEENRAKERAATLKKAQEEWSAALTQLKELLD